MSDPLAVAVDDGSGRRFITEHVSDLSFSETAPGGHSVASCSINLPLSAFPNLGPNDRLYVFDGTMGKTAWEGYTNNPGHRADAAGEGFDVTANGGMILAADRSERLIYRDPALDSWSTDNNSGARGTIGSLGSSSGATVEVGNFPKDAGTRAGDPGLFMQFPKGMAVDTASQAVIRYRQFADSPMSLGAVHYYCDGGSSTSNYQVTVGIEGLAGTMPVELLDFTDLFAIGHNTDYITANNLTDREVYIFLQSNVTSEVGSNNIWFAMGETGVLGKPVDRYGVPYNNPRTTHWLASEVAEDLFGRLLRDQIDQATLEVVTSTYPIDALTFLDPTTAVGAFSSLLLLEDYDWGIGASRNGKHRAWFRPWPTTPRYVLTDRDAISLPGSDDQQVNRVAVEWVSERGYTHVTVVGAYVPELGNMNPVQSSDGRIDPAFVGRIKDADKVTLPDGHGSAPNARQAGARALAEKNRAALSGTATVTRPLLDLVTGAQVMPWNLRAGSVARLASQGVNVRITEKAYNHNDRAATLTLNTPVPSLEEMLARLAARRQR